MTTKQFRTLTLDNAAVGLKVICKDHPEWGVKTLQYDGYFWSHNDFRGGAVLHYGEFHFWRLAEKDEI